MSKDLSLRESRLAAALYGRGDHVRVRRVETYCRVGRQQVKNDLSDMIASDLVAHRTRYGADVFRLTNKGESAFENHLRKQ